MWVLCISHIHKFNLWGVAKVLKHYASLTLLKYVIIKLVIINYDLIIRVLLVKSKFMRKTIIFVAILGIALVGFGQAQATTTATTTISSLLEQLSALQTQLQELRSQQQTIIADLTRNLSLGASGDDVKALQEFLASQPGVYPEKLATGYFGPLTLNAVKKFQKINGLEAVGNVGPLTRNLIKNFKSKKGVSILENSPTTPIGTTTPISLGSTITICHYPAGNPANKQTITIGAAAWKAHQKHGDTMGPCDGTSSNDDEDDNDDDLKDVTAPVISDIEKEIASTTASISWKTNEAATGKFYYGTTDPLALASSTLINLASNTSHDVNLSDLATSTTYNFLIEATDAAGNKASISQSFNTTE